MSPNEIIREFRRKYEGTFVFVEMPDKPGEDNLFSMQSIEEGTGTMTLLSEDFGKIKLNHGTAHTIKFKFPKVSVFQRGTDALLFLRSPQRQWQRGLCNGNCSIQNVAAKFRTRQVPSQEILNFTTVQAAFNELTFPYVKAVDMLRSGKYRSVAIGNGFSVMLSFSSSYEYFIMFWQAPVAAMDKAGKLVVLEPSMETQIMKVIR